jgi:hypothetical protein
MADEPQAGQGALLGIAQKLAAEESRQITTGLNGATSSASLPNRPEALDLYWSGYLKRLQLAGQPVANGPGSSLSAASASAASAAHAQLLQTLGGHKGAAPAAPGPSGLAGSSIGPGGLAAPRAVRPQDSQASMQLADLAMALKKQAAAPLPGTSGASAFSQPAAAAWGNDGGSSGNGGGSSTPSRPAGMRRQGSDGLRRGSSGSLPSGMRGTTAPATGRRTGKRTARDALASEALPFKKRMDLNRAAATAAAADDDGSESAEEGAEMALVRMRSGEAPLALPSADDLGKDDEMPTAGGPKCSKEKNRQAQRRFRERQKTLIGDLRENVRLLHSEVESQSKQIFVLQEENRLLKVLLGDRQVMAAGQPPQQQQS